MIIESQIHEERKTTYAVKCWKRLEFSSRDYQILRYIGEQRFMSLDQVSRKFYSRQVYQSEESRKQVVYMRLRKFREFGLLETSQTFFEPNQIYYLTKKGRQLLIDRGIANPSLPITSHIDLKTFYHDQTLTNCRILLEDTCSVIRWTPETILKAEGFGCEKIPDGLFYVQDKPIAFELEISEKGKSRYINIFNGYDSLAHLKLILYVIKEPSHLRKLINISSPYSKIFFTDLEGFLSQTKETRFQNAHYSFSLQEILL